MLEPTRIEGSLKRRGGFHARALAWVLVPVSLFIAACSPSVTGNSAPSTAVVAPVADDPASALSSRRSIDDVETTAAGVNGFTPAGSTVFFVVDEPSVHDERVSSHEIGHILGLRHATDDADRLMFSGTNGTTLIGQEEEVARYGAEGLVDGTQ